MIEIEGYEEGRDYILIDGKPFVKVVFPGEGMWVELLDGNPFKGTGRVDNESICDNPEYNSIISFDEGTETSKPQFIGGR
ncbi:MAG: hypothetical protein ACYDFU_06690 [Nitrospirota bacterium]